MLYSLLLTIMDDGLGVFNLLHADHAFTYHNFSWDASRATFDNLIETGSNRDIAAGIVAVANAYRAIANEGDMPDWYHTYSGVKTGLVLCVRVVFFGV